MSRQAQLESIAQRAIDAAKKTQSPKERDEYRRIAKEAIDELKTMKAASEVTVSKPPVRTTPAPAPVTAPVVRPPLAPTVAAPMADDALTVSEVGLPAPGQGRSITDVAATAVPEIGAATAQNAATVGGVLGSILGSRYGGKGAVAGGALGTFTGSLIEDYYNEVPLSYTNAALEAAISAGIDVTMLGGGAVFKASLQKAFNLGRTPEQAINDIANSTTKTAAGSPESLAQTQQTLLRSGETLTAGTVGPGAGLRAHADSISREALITRGSYDQRNERIQTIMGDELEALYAGTAGRSMTNDEVGQFVYEIISGGKQALTANYGATLDVIGKDLQGKVINTNGIRNTVEKYLRENTSDFGGSKLLPETVKFIEDRLKDIPIGGGKASDMLEYDKKFTALINQYGDINNKNFNNDVSIQLLKFADKYRKSMAGALVMTDPKAAKAYMKLKNEYAEGVGQLLPEINSDLVTKAAKSGKFEPLGALLTQANSLDKLKAAKLAIRKAYALMPQSTIDNMAIKTADEAFDTLGDGYLTHLFKSEMQGGEGIERLGKLSVKLDSPEAYKRLVAVLGPEKAASVKRFTNFIEDVKTKPKGSGGTLVMRGLEYSSLATVPTAFMTGTGVPYAMGQAAAVTVGPLALMKLAQNPTAVNKIILASKNPKNDTANKMVIAINNIIDEAGIWEDVRQGTDDYFNEQEAKANRYP